METSVSSQPSHPPFKPLRLNPLFHEKIWGSRRLSPWFKSSGRQIGEVWLTNCVQPEPVSAKFIFASEKLSIQVHPPDDFAYAHEEGALGKDEMWYILRAQAGAVIAYGLREKISREELRAVALSGKIESILNFMPVKRGDILYIPAGTIHAIGKGIALCEIQEISDITYRLYDYGRPRELHIDKAVQVCNLDVHPNKIVPIGLGKELRRMVACKNFVADLLSLEEPYLVTASPVQPFMLIVLEGAGKLGRELFKAGDGWLIPVGAFSLKLNPAGACKMIRTFAP
jgi:mannose-6-phosphate isomerase